MAEQMVQKRDHLSAGAHDIQPMLSHGLTVAHLHQVEQLLTYYANVAVAEEQVRTADVILHHWRRAPV
jgi:hypothetical protein